MEDRAFGNQMEEMFERDLGNSREIRLGGTARRPKAEPDRHIDPPRRRTPRGSLAGGSSGSAPRAIATAARAGGAAVGGSASELRGHERRVGAAVNGALLGTAALGARFPRAVAWPLAAVGGLVGATGLVRILRARAPRQRDEAAARPPVRGRSIVCG